MNWECVTHRYSNAPSGSRVHPKLPSGNQVELRSPNNNGRLDTESVTEK